MRNIAIIDDAFDSNASSAYQLSIQYHERFCTISILDTASMKYLAFKNFWFSEAIPVAKQTDQIRNLLHAESYLVRNYKAVTFMYLTPVSVLIPAPLFRKDKPEDYFKYSAHLNPEDKVCYRKIHAIDAYAVFPVPVDFYNQVRLMVPDVQFFHQMCPQIEEAIAETNEFAGQNRVMANINPGFADLMIMQDDKLILYNSFAIKNTEDLVFFILYLYEQFGLSQQETPVILSGFPELYPGATELLYKFLGKVLFREFPDKFTYSATFGELAKHQFSQILNLARCE